MIARNNLPYGTTTGAAASRFDSAYFRSHDALSQIPSDAQSVRSQATYSSGIPFSQAGGYPNSVKRGNTSSYASSAFSQDLTSTTDGSSSIGGENGGGRYNEGSINDGASSIAYSQADRLRRSSISASDVVSQFDYKSQEGNWRDDEDEDNRSVISSSGVTEY